MRLGALFSATMTVFSLLVGQINGPRTLFGALDSGGPILREQAAYDVTYYHLKLSLDPSQRSLAGDVLVRAVAIDTLSQFVLDLDDRFAVSKVVWTVPGESQQDLSFVRLAGRIWISLPRQIKTSGVIGVDVYYGGIPREGKDSPPPGDGFYWATAAGYPWAGVSCETEGADIWWPCKDHPSDEPDSAAIDLTVPKPLTAVSNGRLVKTTDNGMSQTFQWRVSTPINNYCVSLYMGAYELIPVNYTSITGEKIPAEWWFLPANVEKAKASMQTYLGYLRFLEEISGPFPFRSDKHCFVDWSPIGSGMEHQTAVAVTIGGITAYGYDYLVFHELAHEWWGNLVTAKDWSDVWIHEGTATYAEALYVERMSGFARFKEMVASRKKWINNVMKSAISPESSQTASQAFGSGNNYYRAAAVVHTLRYYLGDSTFFKVLRRWTYPEPAVEMVTNGKQCRLATTNEFRAIAEKVSGQSLDWFFKAYFREVALPQLWYWQTDTSVTLRWTTEGGGAFPMPVDANISGRTMRVEMNGNRGTLYFPRGSSVKIDPDGWLLTPDLKVTSVEVQSRELVQRELTCDVYPNPFNASTIMRLFLPNGGKVKATVYSLLGQEVKLIVNEDLAPGSHSYPLHFPGLSSGIYYLQVVGNQDRVVQKLVFEK